MHPVAPNHSHPDFIKASSLIPPASSSPAQTDRITATSSAKMPPALRQQQPSGPRFSTTGMTEDLSSSIVDDAQKKIIMIPIDYLLPGYQHRSIENQIKTHFGTKIAFGIGTSK